MICEKNYSVIQKNWTPTKFPNNLNKYWPVSIIFAENIVYPKDVFTFFVVVQLTASRFVWMTEWVMQLLLKIFDL